MNKLSSNQKSKRFSASSLKPAKNKVDELEFCQDGVQIFRSFLPRNLIFELNEELDLLFKDFAINKRLNSSAIINRYLSQLTQASTLNSINVLEIGIDIFNLIKDKVELSNYIITNIEIFSEKNNPNILPFHTDERRGMIRAQIYLKGGASQSGGFKYIQGTNQLEHSVKHHLSSSEITECNKWIHNIYGDLGDLVIFDPWGFHGKDICVNERRTILFEFQPKDSNYVKASIYINNRKITHKVIDHFHLFLAGKESTYGTHGIEFIENDYRSFRMIKTIIQEYLSQIKNSILNKLKIF